MKRLGIVLLTMMLCGNSLMAKNIDEPQIYGTRVAVEDVISTVPYIKSSDILGGMGEYFHARNLASLLGYYTYFQNDILRFESVKSDVNPIIIEFDLKNKIGYAYDKNELIEGIAISNLPSYKRLSNIPVKVQESYFVHMKDFCEALGLETQFVMNFSNGTYHEIKNENMVIMTPTEDKAIKEQVDRLMKNELLDCRCTQAGMSTHIADRKYLEAGEGMNSLACYLITEKYGTTNQLPQVENTTGEYKGKVGTGRVMVHIKENRGTDGKILQIKKENGRMGVWLNKYAREIDRNLDRAVRFSSEHQMGTLSGNFSIDSIIDDYNCFIDLYNRAYSQSDIKLSKIKVTPKN